VTSNGEHARDTQHSNCLWQINSIVLIVLLIASRRDCVRDWKGNLFTINRRKHISYKILFSCGTLPQTDTEA